LNKRVFMTKQPQFNKIFPMGDRMKKFSAALIMTAILFLTSTVLAQQTKESVIAAYIQASKAKLSPAFQRALTPGAKLGAEIPHGNFLYDLSTEKLNGTGIPRAVKSGSEKTPIEHAHFFRLGGFSFVNAEYQGNISELYIKKKGGRYKFLFHFDACNKIYLLKPGEKAPPFLVIRVSNCSIPDNWQETVYQMSKSGRLEEVGHLGGQKAKVQLVDLDNDGVLELINSTTTNHYPADLEAQLKALPGYQEPTGPVLNDNIVYKWNGTEWAKTAEFYDQVE